MGGRTQGTPNVRSTQTVQLFQSYINKYKLDPMELLFMAMAGKIKGVKGRLLGQDCVKDYINVRLTAAKELLPYGYSKIATVKHEITGTDEPIVLAWEGQQDLFEEPMSLSDKIDSLHHLPDA